MIRSERNISSICFTAQKGAKQAGAHQCLAAKAWVESFAGTMLVMLAVWLTAWGSSVSFAADTNRIRVGVFPFENTSGDTNLTHWSRVFPDQIQDQLLHGSPPRVDAWVNKVRKELTNNAWNGEAITRELAETVARKLGLQQIMLGTFSRDDGEWKVQARILAPGEASALRTIEIKESATQDLWVRLVEKACEAFGVKPDDTALRILREPKVSNEAIEKAIAIGYVEAPPEEAVHVLRALATAQPGFIPTHLAQVSGWLAMDKPEEAAAEARKVVELAPGFCRGYLALAVALKGGENSSARVQAMRKALEVHPGCQDIGRLFPYLVDDERWLELKELAEKARDARPDDPAFVAALAMANARLGNQEQAVKLLDEMGTLQETIDTFVHRMAFEAAVHTMTFQHLARELLWLQRNRAGDDLARDLASEIDATAQLTYRGPTNHEPSTPAPRQYEPEELRSELLQRLTPQEYQRIENPIAITEATAATARTLTAGLSNTFCKATVLFGLVVEERLKDAQLATNPDKVVQLPVCHQYASRLVSLAKSAGLPAWLVHVELQSAEVSGFHDRAAIQLGRDLVLQFDPTFGVIAGSEDKSRVLDEVQAIAHHMLQENDLANVRIAQKLDPADPWTRVNVITRLAMLSRTEEAQKLWDELTPEFTNRWDYYYSRAGIESANRRNNVALGWLERAQDMSTNNLHILQALVGVYEALNDKAKSAECLEKVIQLGAGQHSAKERAEFEARMNFNRASAEARRTSEQELRARAAKGDDAAHMVLVNKLFAQGRNEEALNDLLEMAKRGNVVCQVNYGRNLYLLKGLAGAPEATEWLRKAALQNCTDVCYLLSTILYEGKGVPRDETEAVLWAHVGSANQNKNCQNLLKEMQLFADPDAFAEGKKRAETFLKEQHSPATREKVGGR
jgi:tetratricopeptide (TPR) repeat protein